MCTKYKIFHTGFVSNRGSDVPYCGLTMPQPCRTLEYTVSLLGNKSVIYLLPEGPAPQQSVFDPGGNGTVFSALVTNDITIDGSYGE